MKSDEEASSPSKMPALVQVAALPMRLAENGVPQVLLLTSRETKRWVIPKGWPMKGRKNWEAAAQEALEEAGIEGRARKKSIGNFLYFKRRDAHFDLCRVEVYLLDFARQLGTWREKGQREAKWFALEEAADLVEEPGLTAILRDFDVTCLADRKSKVRAKKGHAKGGERRGSRVDERRQDLTSVSSNE